MLAGVFIRHLLAHVDHGGDVKHMAELFAGALDG